MNIWYDDIFGIDIFPKGTAEEIRNIVQPDDQKSHKIHSGATSSKTVDLDDAELLKVQVTGLQTQPDLRNVTCKT